MAGAMKDVREVILSGKASGADYSALPLPESMRAVTTHKDEEGLFEGLESPRQGPAAQPAPRGGGRSRRWVPTKPWSP